MKVTITKWNAVATWRWDIPDDDVCGICQVAFDGTCPTCKYPGDGCPLRKFSLFWPDDILQSILISYQCPERVGIIFTWWVVAG